MDTLQTIPEQEITNYFYYYLQPEGEKTTVQTTKNLDPLPEGWFQITEAEYNDINFHDFFPTDSSKVLAIASNQFRLEDIIDSEEREHITQQLEEYNERMKNWIPADEVRVQAFGENSDYIDTTEKAQKINAILKNAIKELPDNEAAEVAELFPAWSSTETYSAQDRVYYNGQLYRCLSPHSAQETWTPEDAHSLWTKVLTSPTEILEWQQPDSTNPYNKGDRVYYNGELYESELDGNVWSPATFGWKKIEQ